MDGITTSLHSSLTPWEYLRLISWACHLTLSQAHRKPWKPWRHGYIQTPLRQYLEMFSKTGLVSVLRGFPAAILYREDVTFQVELGISLKHFFLFCPLPPEREKTLLPFPMSFLSSFCFVFELSTPWRFLCITHISSLKNISSPGQPLKFPFKHVTKISSIWFWSKTSPALVSVRLVHEIERPESQNE